MTTFGIKQQFKLAYGAARRSHKTRSGLTVVCPGGTPAVVRTLRRAMVDPFRACDLAVKARRCAAQRFAPEGPLGVEGYIQPLPA